MTHSYTVLEIGSGSFKLYKEGLFDLRFQSSLGKGLKNGELNQDSIQIANRSLEEEILPLLKKHSISNNEIIVFATAAIRESQHSLSGKSFINQLKKLGFTNLKIFSEDDECLYAALAVIDELKKDHSDYLILDTGGASHQLIEVNQNHIRLQKSFPIGSHSKIQSLPNFKEFGYTTKLPIVLLGTSGLIIKSFENPNTKILNNILGKLINANIEERRAILKQEIKDTSTYPLLVDFRLEILPNAFRIIQNVVDNLESNQFLFSSTQAINYIARNGIT